ncbi:hypothetical protein LCGC14_1230630 [marine sediment metagenome]|uniref:Uncharacterized protein n=1 Tax=marine sediment metagenome TaxID=412755 RepID=A0A0F9LCR8_9ZZZZ
MFLEVKSSKKFTKTILKLLDRLNSLTEAQNFDSNIFKLQLNGFNLDCINVIDYSVIGIFKQNNFTKEIQIPSYKINEDILDQLEGFIEEYNTYLLENQNQDYENDKRRTKVKELINLNSKDIDWDKIYNTKIYAQIAFKYYN